MTLHKDRAYWIQYWIPIGMRMREQGRSTDFPLPARARAQPHAMCTPPTRRPTLPVPCHHTIIGYKR